LIQQSQSFKAIQQHETLAALLNLLQYLKEDDYRLLAGLWYERAIHNKTRQTISYEQRLLYSIYLLNLIEFLILMKILFVIAGVAVDK
jgi:hypothetical protein